MCTYGKRRPVHDLGVIKKKNAGPNGISIVAMSNNNP